MCCTHAKGQGEEPEQGASCYTLCATPKCMDNEQSGRGAGHANCWQSGIQLAKAKVVIAAATANMATRQLSPIKRAEIHLQI